MKVAGAVAKNDLPHKHQRYGILVYEIFKQETFSAQPSLKLTFHQIDHGSKQKILKICRFQESCSIHYQLRNPENTNQFIITHDSKFHATRCDRLW